MDSIFVDALARARIGRTHNQYAHSELRRERLTRYLASRAAARVMLVGEAAGYRGARISGVPFTSERQLTGAGFAEATATVVHRVLRDLGLEEEVLLWNLVPTHPHRAGEPQSNRPPTSSEIRAARPFLHALAVSGSSNRLLLAVGRLAQQELGGPYIRHPSHGGATTFRESLRSCLTG
jgi:uracil-DNA glycosylase